MIGDLKELKCSNLLFGETREFNYFCHLLLLFQHLPSDLDGLLFKTLLSAFLSTFLPAVLLGVANLIAYVSFCGHGVFVFDLVLGSKCSNICRFKQLYRGGAELLADGFNGLSDLTHRFLARIGKAALVRAHTTFVDSRVLSKLADI